MRPFLFLPATVKSALPAIRRARVPADEGPVAADDHAVGANRVDEEAEAGFAAGQEIVVDLIW